MTADEILAELLTDSARADPYPLYRPLRELGPIAPLAQRLAGVTPFAAVATGYDLVDRCCGTSASTSRPPRTGAAHRC